MANLQQKVRTPSRNVNLYVMSDDFPSFDILINGQKYEPNTQDSKNLFNDFIPNRSRRNSKQIQNSNALQRAIVDRLYKKISRL